MFNTLDINSGVTYSIELPLSDKVHEDFKYTLDVSLNGAMKGRKEEFIAGRACALLGLKELGSKFEIVKRSSSRKPIWPKGFIGSITHTKDLAMASVYKEDFCRSVGIDCEVLIKPERFDKIKEYITRKEDLTILNTDKSCKLSHIQTLIFSAKESLYKAINPLCDEFFGFQEAFISSVNHDEGSFVIVLDTSIVKLKPFESSYFGRFICTEKHIITSIEIV